MADSVRGLDRLAQKVRPHIPFTILNSLWRSLDKQSKSILDLGCGQGAPLKFINKDRLFYTVGVDIFRPYLEKGKRERIHDGYVICDVRHLPFKKRSFDIVLCLEVLEHMDKEEGKRLIDSIGEIARRQVIISTPVSARQQHKDLLQDGNPFQIHRAGWEPAELRQLGYKVRGSTLRWLASGKAGKLSFFPRPLRFLDYLLWLVTSAPAYFLPGIADDMLCVKKLKTEKTS